MDFLINVFHGVTFAKAAQTPDWPNRDNILTYRTALRDWPSTSDFPDTRPTLGS